MGDVFYFKSIIIPSINLIYFHTCCHASKDATVIKRLEHYYSFPYLWQPIFYAYPITWFHFSNIKVFFQYLVDIFTLILGQTLKNFF